MAIRIWTHLLRIVGYPFLLCEKAKIVLLYFYVFGPHMSIDISIMSRWIYNALLDFTILLMLIHKKVYIFGSVLVISRCDQIMGWVLITWLLFIVDRYCVP